MEMLKNTGISRRELVGGAVALAAMGALGGCSTTDRDDSTETTAIIPADQTLETDIVILGSGIAGLSAAIEAAQQGAGVVLLEKEKVLGGNTNVAEGIFAVGSSLQKELGIEVSIDEILADEYEFQNYNLNPKLWEEVAQNSAANIDWLLELGVEFETVTAPAAGAKTWHVFEGGRSKAAIDVLGPFAEKLGVQIMTSTPGSSILLTDGVVSGVRATVDDDSLIDVYAKAVILATGGMAANTEELLKRTDVESGRFNYWGLMGQTGDGIIMAEEAGMGKATHITVCNLGMSVPGLGLSDEFGICIGNEPTNLWVNQDAVRFIPESYTFHPPGAANAVLNQIKVFSIMDQTTIDRVVNEGPILGLGAYVRAGVPCTELRTMAQDAIESNSENVFVADTVEALAEAMGINPQTFAETVEQYNTYCDAGFDAQYNKTPDYLAKLRVAPFYAARIAAITLNTLGGIRVNLDMEVITVDGTEIPGLYAAGMECSGFSGETYGLLVPGSTLGIALATGRVAGNSAAAYATA